MNNVARICLLAFCIPDSLLRKKIKMNLSDVVVIQVFKTFLLRLLLWINVLKTFLRVYIKNSHHYNISICFNPLNDNNQYILHTNLTFLWSRTPKRGPKSFATHAPLYITVYPRITKNSKISHFPAMLKKLKGTRNVRK